MSGMSHIGTQKTLARMKKVRQVKKQVHPCPRCYRPLIGDECESPGCKLSPAPGGGVEGDVPPVSRPSRQ